MSPEHALQQGIIFIVSWVIMMIVIILAFVAILYYKARLNIFFIRKGIDYLDKNVKDRE